VWETFANLDKYPEKTKVLLEGDVFTSDLLDSYRRAVLLRWTLELSDRIIQDNAKVVRACGRLDGENRLDAERWEKIHALKNELARDDLACRSRSPSGITQLGDDCSPFGVLFLVRMEDGGASSLRPGQAGAGGSNHVYLAYGIRAA
jgi:hypothetical protein